MAYIRPQSSTKHVAINVVIVFEYTRHGYCKDCVFSHSIFIIYSNRRIVDWVNSNGHSCHFTFQITIAGFICESIGAIVVLVRRVNKATIGIEHKFTMANGIDQNRG